MRRQDDVALYVLDLPVTTEDARNAGKEVWGYPKYVTGITTSFTAEGHSSELKDEYTLTHQKGLNVPLGGIPFVTFSVNDGHLIRTIINTGHVCYFGGSASIIDLGLDGATINTMRTLGMLDQTPLTSFRTDAMTSHLPEGVSLGKVQ
mmetsp:Transcript_66959/g.157973  ORF Transcript_66959/g.157973 Transcript_66959/m.157973 type:complete len:148 (+) Transcript_66959:473-916(+)